MFVGVVVNEEVLPEVGDADVPTGDDTVQAYVAPDDGVALKLRAVPLHCVPVGEPCVAPGTVTVIVLEVTVQPDDPTIT